MFNTELEQFARSFDPGALPSGAVVLQRGRNLTLRMPLGDRDAVVKCFPKASPFRAALDRAAGRGTKAARSDAAARFLFSKIPGSTPEPLGLVETDNGGFFATAYEADLESFTSRLASIYAAHGTTEELMALIERIAHACKAFHDAGFFHGDLGNQNLQLAPDGRVLLVDLNRARFSDAPLDLRARARDLSRIALPSDFLRVFFEMYWNDVPPREFLRAERRFRDAFALHTATRGLRHPFRPRKASPEPEYPAPRDLWVWDERSEQPLVTMRPRDRRRYQSVTRVTEPIAALAPTAAKMRRHEAMLRSVAFERPVLSFASRAFVSISADPMRFSRELDFLADLNCPGVHLRFYAHDSEENTAFKIDAVRKLRGIGRAVAVSLVQCRDSVRDPAAWKAFCGRVLREIHGEAIWVEYLHAVNRVKWGLWNFRELRALASVLTDLRREFPDVAFLAPSSIDFEWDYFAAALNVFSRENRRAKLAPLAGASTELYVDRRGAPERHQGRFDAVGKLRRLGAIASCFPAATERHVVVTEFNWPLAGTGVWSPVGSPYVSPGARFNDPSVREEDAAAYTIRYLLLGLCSGLANGMVYWELAAHGFGLVDNGEGPAEDWRARPAFAALKTFHALLGHVNFVSAPIHGENGAWLLRMRSPDGHDLAVAWTSADAPRHAATAEELGFEPAKAFDMRGDAIAPDTPLTGSPIYLFA